MSSGLSGYVVGLSGGIDSAVVAFLAAKAVGADNLMGLLMPFRTSSDASVKDALNIAEKLGIEYKKIDISPMIDAYFPKIEGGIKIRAGNKMARERMSILFDLAHQMNRLVLGTGNRTEICLGYTTLFGDSACSVNPLGELYKTEVRAIAKFLGIPGSIIEKPPSADLWEGQTDEDEIGLKYEVIDKLLSRIVDDGCLSMAELEGEGFLATDVSRVISLMNRNAFKRQLPPIAPMNKKEIPIHIALEP